MGLTFWETVYQGGLRDAVVGHRWDPETVLQGFSNHGVTESCTIAAAEHGAPPGAGAMIASEMAAFRERAAEAAKIRAHGRRPWAVGLMMAILCGGLLYDIVRHVVRDVQRGQPWIGSVIGEMCLFAIFAVLGFGVRGMAMGEVQLMNRLCADWAERLGGKFGADVLDEVVAWLEARWAWFLPPRMGANDVLWAIGTRRGVPVLAVLERYTGTLVRSMAKGVALRVRNTRVPGGMWTRTSIFLHGVRFRDGAHKERIRKTLGQMGGGVIQGANGVYIYGVFAFMRLFRKEGPTSEIWIDLVDQVVDPDFHGSESAARQLQDELALYGLAAPPETPHA